MPYNNKRFPEYVGGEDDFWIDIRQTPEDYGEIIKHRRKKLEEIRQRNAETPLGEEEPYWGSAPDINSLYPVMTRPVSEGQPFTTPHLARPVPRGVQPLPRTPMVNTGASRFDMPHKQPRPMDYHPHAQYYDETRKAQEQATQNRIQSKRVPETGGTINLKKSAHLKDTPMKKWDGKPYEGNRWKPDFSLNEYGLPRGLLGARDEQGRQTHRGLFGGISGWAKDFFNDPSRVALTQAGLTAMNPNSYYDAQGFSSGLGGLNKAIGAGVKTYQDLMNPVGGWNRGEFGRILQQYNALPEGHPDKPFLRRRLDKLNAISGTVNKQSSALNNYEWAVRNKQFDGTFPEWLQMVKKAGRPTTNINMPKPSGYTKGFESTDKKFGEQYAQWFMEGGSADAVKQMSQLQEVGMKLDAIAAGELDENLTGAMLNLIPDFVKTFTHPESIAAKEAVEEVVQRNLRRVLGAQFTENEGKRLIARAYNPALDEAENAKRVNRLFKQMAIALKQKEEAMNYFGKHGTLMGFTGHIPSIADFDSALDTPTATASDEMPEGFEEVE